MSHFDRDMKIFFSMKGVDTPSTAWYFAARTRNDHKCGKECLNAEAVCNADHRWDLRRRRPHGPSARPDR